jgi:signal transduction histidine kinase
MDDKWIMHHPSIVSIQSKRGSDDFIEQNNILPVFMQIAGIVLKKLEFDDMEEQLLISEEQNRIANEIHDIVLQKLFAISCRLYVLSSSDKKYSIDDVREELSGIKKSIDITMKDLREAIYGLSWEKQGEDTFKNKLLRYTEEIRQLQGIEAYTIIEGDTQKIRPNQKHGMYRMICEAMNNAVRHGNAKHISVQIIIEDSLTKIRIFDDGKGFDYDEYIQREEKGLGLNNIYRIIELLNGHIEINTKISGGTEITMTIPSRPAA